jgi:hypothetical protein
MGRTFHCTQGYRPWISLQYPDGQEVPNSCNIEHLCCFYPWSPRDMFYWCLEIDTSSTTPFYQFTTGIMCKLAHFIPVKTTYTGARFAELYISRIVCLHGVHKKIVSGRDTQFTSWFWQKLHELISAPLIIRRLIGRQKGPTKCCKICLGLVP